ncbi:MAG: hypothetical protein JSS02_07290 [Planctomycetes bacterium]|nr:hypothetical protein [Planctomycetota bacterium]
MADSVSITTPVAGGQVPVIGGSVSVTAHVTTDHVVQSVVAQRVGGTGTTPLNPVGSGNYSNMVPGIPLGAFEIKVTARLTEKGAEVATVTDTQSYTGVNGP